MRPEAWRNLARWLLRVALAASFLSAVADRLGFWGPPGASGVAWGEWSAFQRYVGVLNWFLPVAIIPAVAWLATAAEVALAVALLVGWRLRQVATASSLLLATFAVTMTLAGGIKGPLDYSVFTAAAGALLLAVDTRSRQRSLPRS